MQKMEKFEEVKEQYDQLIDLVDNLPDEQQKNFQDITIHLANYLQDKGELGIMALFYFYYQHMMVITVSDYPQSPSRCESGEKP